MYRKVDLGLLLQFDPKQAKTKLLAAFKDADGSTKAVAEATGVRACTVRRWIETLEGKGFKLRTRIQRMRDTA